MGIWMQEPAHVTVQMAIVDLTVEVSVLYGCSLDVMLSYVCAHEDDEDEDDKDDVRSDVDHFT